MRPASKHSTPADLDHNGLAPAATPDNAAGVPTTSKQFRPLALAAITVALIVMSVLVALPFLPALTWSVALAIVAWPMHAWISRRVAWPSLAAAISTVVVLLVILVPILFVTYHLARELGTAADRVPDKPTEEVVRDAMARTPGISNVVAWMDRVNFDLEHEIRSVISAFNQGTLGFVQSSMSVPIQLALAVFILYYLLRDRGRLLGGARGMLPLTRAESSRVFTRIADSVHATVVATLITSLIGGVGGGLMFWLLGLPSPILWGVVMFVLSVLPILGVGMVWVPAVIYLFLSDRWLAAMALAGWGVAEWIMIDTILYTRLAGERMRMHDVPALIAFLGGLAVFGVSGMVLGPAIYAVTAALLEVWKQRTAAAEEHSPDSHAPETAVETRQRAGQPVAIG